MGHGINFATSPANPNEPDLTHFDLMGRRGRLNPHINIQPVPGEHYGPRSESGEMPRYAGFGDDYLKSHEQKFREDQARRWHGINPPEPGLFPRYFHRGGPDRLYASAGTTNHHSIENNIGEIHVHTQATDAAGIAKDIKPAASFAMHSNYSLA
jgi:hypothetical protein